MSFIDAIAFYFNAGSLTLLVSENSVKNRLDFRPNSGWKSSLSDTTFRFCNTCRDLSTHKDPTLTICGGLLPINTRTYVATIQKVKIYRVIDHTGNLNIPKIIRRILYSLLWRKNKKSLVIFCLVGKAHTMYSTSIVVLSAQ